MRLLLSIALIALSLWGADQASDYARMARDAEKAGDLANAYIYYTQAAALSPSDRTYWAKSEVLRTRALGKANLVPAGLAAALADTTVTEKPDLDPSILGRITQRDIEEVRRYKPPVALAGSTGKSALELEGDGKQLWEALARQIGLTVIFDDNYQAGRSQRIRGGDVEWRDAIQILSTATSSFVVPIHPKLMLVANDNQQNRTALEPVMAVTIPLPDAVSTQDAQEAALAVQQTMEIRRLVLDTTRHMVLVRDTVSKVRPAQALFEQLVGRRPEVVVEIEFLEANESSSLRYGLDLQSSFPLVWLGDLKNVFTTIPTGFRFVTFGGGATMFGVGLANSELFASMTRSSTRTLLKSTLRAVAGQKATLHVGERYPILQAGYFGRIEGEGEVFRPPPTITWEDLGVAITVTPHVHGADDVTLEIEAKYKVLAGEAVNGIPVISARQFQGVVRVPQGEWALMSGLATTSEVRSLTGLAGLSQIPLVGPIFRRTTTEKSSTQALIVIKPRLVSAPQAKPSSKAIWTGTESRMVPLL